MSKALVTSLIAALVCTGGAVANAADGISSGTLSEMGLSGLTVMSDSDALSVRGKGYVGGGQSGYCKTCPRGKKPPWSVAFGNSFATIEVEDPATAHSENGYLAEGPYAASGENFSEAAAEQTHIETVNIDGSIKTISTTWKTHVWAGGFSSAMSF